MKAAARFGLDPELYFGKERLTRAAMTAFVRIEDATNAMQSYDMAEKLKRKRKP